jgi:hypothetical protein
MISHIFPCWVAHLVRPPPRSATWPKRARRGVRCATRSTRG